MGGPSGGGVDGASRRVRLSLAISWPVFVLPSVADRAARLAALVSTRTVTGTVFVLRLRPRCRGVGTASDPFPFLTSLPLAFGFDACRGPPFLPVRGPGRMQPHGAGPALLGGSVAPTGLQ